MEEQIQQENAQESLKIVKASDIISYLENTVMYLEALQQDMIKNINQLKETDTNA